MTMIRRHYALPADELGCQAVELLHVHITPSSLIVEVQPGTATLEGGQTIDTGSGQMIRMGAKVVEGTFERVEEVRQPSAHGRVQDVGRFLAWFDEHYAKSSADTHVQQLVSGALEYLWRQRAGLLPEPEGD